MENILYKEILEKINDMEIIDTHEHIRSQEEVNRESINVFRVFENSYARLDYISAGMPPKIWSKDDIKEIWKTFKEYQKKVSLTTFVKNIIRSLQDLYGLEGDFITEDNWLDLSEKIKEAYQRNDWYNYVLKKQAKFKISLLDSSWSVEKFDYDKSLFIPILRTNPFILGRKYTSPFVKGKYVRTSIEKISESWKIKIDDFESYMTIVDTAIQKYKKMGCPAIKIATAYQRSLYFEKVSRNTAASIYAKNPETITPDEQKKLQDYITHYLIQKATEENMVVQIHTGTFGENGNIISNGNPEQLNNLFLEYPNTKFVLFHFSYPYTSQVFSLAKMFTNIALDFCWVPMFSNNFAKRSLNEFFDLIPYNKLMWGGDSMRVEEAYGSSCLAREIISSVLAERVKKKNINMYRAFEIANAILYNNALKYYNLDKLL